MAAWMLSERTGRRSKHPTAAAQFLRLTRIQPRYDLSQSAGRFEEVNIATTSITKLAVLPTDDCVIRPPRLAAVFGGTTQEEA